MSAFADEAGVGTGDLERERLSLFQAIDAQVPPTGPPASRIPGGHDPQGPRRLIEGDDFGAASFKVSVDGDLCTSGSAQQEPNGREPACSRRATKVRRHANQKPRPVVAVCGLPCTATTGRGFENSRKNVLG